MPHCENTDAISVCQRPAAPPRARAARAALNAGSVTTATGNTGRCDRNRRTSIARNARVVRQQPADAGERERACGEIERRRNGKHHAR